MGACRTIPTVIQTPNDLEAIDAWLNDPTVQALHADLGRQFRSLPLAARLPIPP